MRELYTQHGPLIVRTLTVAGCVERADLFECAAWTDGL
jgi:hypothetical protein